MRSTASKVTLPLLLPPKACELAPVQKAVQWADHLAFFFPLWLDGMPAVLKGFPEQLARPGFALSGTSGGMPKKLLGGRSARLVVTMGCRRWSIAGSSARTA